MQKYKNIVASVSKITYIMAIIVASILLIWMSASFFEVITHNLDTDYVYKSWNLFTILFH